MGVKSKRRRGRRILATNLMQIYGLDAQAVAMIFGKTAKWANAIALEYDMPELVCHSGHDDSSRTWSTSDYLALSQDELKRKAGAFEYMMKSGADYIDCKKLARGLRLPETVALAWKTQLE